MLAAGYAPAVGFIHSGKPLSFVYDIADLFKFDTVLPVAFKEAAKPQREIERKVRLGCRDVFRQEKVLKPIIPTIEQVLAAGELPVPDAAPESVVFPAGAGMGAFGDHSLVEKGRSYPGYWRSATCVSTLFSDQSSRTVQGCGEPLGVVTVVQALQSLDRASVWLGQLADVDVVLLKGVFGQEIRGLPAVHVGHAAVALVAAAGPAFGQGLTEGGLHADPFFPGKGAVVADRWALML